ELKSSYFDKLVTRFEAEHGEIPRMFRKPRGVLILPHGGGRIPLGTQLVEAFQRPAWQFNKLLFIEKTGIADILEAAGWPDRHACAVTGAEGCSTRAHRALIAYPAETDEPIGVFALHDADPAGTMIYQTLTEATLGRGARKIAVVDLGLQPWEAIQMGLLA